MGITEHMCGNSYEIVKTWVEDEDENGYDILIDSGSMGIIKRSLGSWAVEKVLTITTTPEYYV